MKTYHYTHPSWDDVLIVSGNNHREQAIDVLGDSDLDFSEVDMEESTFSVIREFQG